MTPNHTPASKNAGAKRFFSRHTAGILLAVAAIGPGAAALIANSAVAADLNRSDKQFLIKAAEAGNTEVKASNLALQKGSSPDVKDFANKMVKDHTEVGNELKQLAASKNVTVPEDPSTMQKAKIAMLGKLDGKRFDHHYADTIGVSAHKDTVKLFQKAASNAKDPDVKAFAEKTLPGLQHHLEMAQQLAADNK